MGDLPTNREKRLKDIENLHRMVRNNTGYDPVKARDTLNSFISYKLLEPFIDDLGLPHECKWSYLLEQKDGDYQHEVLFDGFRAFRQNETTRIFFEIAEHGITNSLALEDIIKAIDNIDLDILDLSDIFENTNSGRNASEQGQYFTPREICKIAIDLALDVKPDVRREDGTLCTFTDLFCGSGGFVTTYIATLKSRYGIKLTDNISDNPIYCMDANSRITSILILNMLINNGVLLNNRHIHLGNTFESRITTEGGVFEGLKVDFGISNPPYGGDKGEGAFKYDRANKEILDIGIKVNKKEYAAVQLYMSILNERGVAALVLPGGFFTNNDAALKIREKLAEEYKILHVVEFPGGTFTNTGCETSLIVFQKGVGTTEEITFWMVDKNGKREVLKVGLEKLRDKNYYLKYSIYMKNERPEYENRDFPMVKLGDIIEVNYGKRITKKADSGTLYPVYGGGNETFRTDKFNREGINCKVSRFGMSLENCVQIIRGKFWVLDSGFTITSKNGAINEYIWLWLIKNKDIVYNCGHRTAQINIDMEMFLSIEIPLPPIHIQNRIGGHLGSLDNLIAIKEQEIKLLEDNLIRYAELIAIRAPYVRLGDICEFKRGKSLTKDKIVEGIYPVIGGGRKPVGYHNEANTPSNTILVSQSGNGGIISRYLDPVWKSDCFSIECIDNKYDNYLYYYLLRDPEIFINLQKGTVQKHVYPSDIEHIEIPYPNLTSDDENVFRTCQNEIDNGRRRIKEYRAMIDKFYQIYMNTPLTDDDLKNIVIPVPTPKNSNLTRNGRKNDGPTVKELKEQCKTLGIKGYTTMKKQDLEATLAAHNQMINDTQQIDIKNSSSKISSITPGPKSFSLPINKFKTPIVIPKVPSLASPQFNQTMTPSLIISGVHIPNIPVTNGTNSRQSLTITSNV